MSREPVLLELSDSRRSDADEEAVRHEVVFVCSQIILHLMLNG